MGGSAGSAGAAHLELVSGVVRLRPQDAMFEAMLAGWRAQQTARGLREELIGSRERLVRRFGEFTTEYPWRWRPSHVDEWSASLTSERHMARSTIRAYQSTVRLFTEFLCDGRYGWVAACEREFGAGVHPEPICHEWNTIAHLNDYEGSPEARPLDRRFIQVAVGHECDTSTAIYTHVSCDFMNTALRKALAPALTAPSGEDS